MKKLINVKFLLFNILLVSGLGSAGAAPNLPENYAAAAKYSAIGLECKNRGFWSDSDWNMIYPEIMSSHLSPGYDRDAYFQQIDIMQKQSVIEMSKPGAEDRLKMFCSQSLIKMAERASRKQNSANNQRALAEFSDAMNQMGKAMNQAGNQTRQQSNSYIPPTVTPLAINPLNNNKLRNCRIAGGIEYCN